MDYKEKSEIIKHITLGTNEVLYYPYKSGKEPLPVRAISYYELNQCFISALHNCSSNDVASLVVKYRIGMLKGEERINISNKGYVELTEFYNEIDEWIVFYGMRDFQDIEFSKPGEDSLPVGISIIRDMTEIGDIANFILSASTKSEEVIKEILRDENGREVAELFYYLKVPLTEISKMTLLQKNYLIYAKGVLENPTEDELKKKYVRTDEEMTYEDFVERFK